MPLESLPNVGGWSAPTAFCHAASPVTTAMLIQSLTAPNPLAPGGDSLSMVRKLFLGIAVVIGIIIQVPANEAASNISTYLDRFLALFGSTNSSLHSPAWLRHQAVDTSIVVALIALCIILVLQLLVPTLRKLIIRPERPSSTSASTASLHKKLAVLSYTRLRRLCRLSTVLRLVVRKATRYARLYVPLEYEVKHFPYSTNSRDFGYFRDDLSAFCSRFIDAFPGSSLLTEIEGTKEIIMRLMSCCVGLLRRSMRHAPLVARRESLRFGGQRAMEICTLLAANGIREIRY